MPARSQTFNPVFDPKRGKAGRRAAQSGAPAGSYEGLVATHIRIPDFQQGSTFVNAMCRTGFKATEDLTAIKIGWANFYIFTGSPTASGATMTVVNAAIEYPIGSARQPLSFGGNASSPACPNGETVFSDYLTLATPIPKGAVARVWFYQSMGGAAGILKRSTGADTTTYGDGATLGTSASPASNVVLSGTMTATNIVPGYVPIAAVVAQTVNKSVIVTGDSIGWAGIGAGGADRPDDLNGRIGLICHGFADDLPFLNLASSGITAAAFLTGGTGAVGRTQLFQYCSHMVEECGINDIRQGTAAATVIAAKQGIAAAFPSRVKKYATTLGPTNATSTAGFTTLASQSPDSLHKTQADAFNASVRGGVVGFDGFFETSDVISSARDSGIWALPPGARTVTDAAITAGAAALTSATANFTTADVGTVVTVPGAGASGGSYAAYISAFVSATQVTMSGNASTTVSGATAYIGSITYEGLHPCPAGYQKVADSGIIAFT